MVGILVSSCVIPVWSRSHPDGIPVGANGIPFISSHWDTGNIWSSRSHPSQHTLLFCTFNCKNWQQESIDEIKLILAVPCLSSRPSVWRSQLPSLYKMSLNTHSYGPSLHFSCLWIAKTSWIKTCKRSHCCHNVGRQF